MIIAYIMGLLFTIGFCTPYCERDKRYDAALIAGILWPLLLPFILGAELGKRLQK